MLPSATISTVSVSLSSSVLSTSVAKWNIVSAQKSPTKYFRDLESDGKSRRADGRTPAQAAAKLQKCLGDLARKSTPQTAEIVRLQVITLGEACEWARAAAEIAGKLPMGDSLRAAADGDRRGVTGECIIARLFGAEGQASMSARLGW